MAIINWNINGLYNNLTDLQILINDLSPKIITLQESHLKPSQKFHFPNFSTVRHDDNTGINARGGVIILINHSIYYTELNINSPLQTCAIQAKISEKMVTICNIYINPLDIITNEDIETLITQLPTPFLLLGDFNAHNTLWQCQRNNRRGKVLEDILWANTSLILLNSGEPTHLNSASGETSIIDLAIVSISITDNIYFSTLDDTFNSDHYPFLILFQDSLNKGQNFYKHNFKNTNWDSYNELFSLQNDTDDAIEAYQSFTDELNRTTNYIVPQNRIGTKKKVPWWNIEIALAIKKRKLALKTYIRTKSEIDKIEYKRFKAKARFLVKNSKKDSWRRFISAFNRDSSTTEIWKNIRKLKGQHTGHQIPALLSNNNIVTETHQISEIFSKTFSNYSNNSELTVEELEIKTTQENNLPLFADNHNESYNTLFTMDELRLATNGIRTNSPGPDMIHPIIIKNLNKTNCTKLLNILNLIWTQETIPASWKRAIIIPIIKQNKQKTDPNNFRPISITCILSKIFEKMVNNRLSWILEERQLLDRFQFGFRKKMSVLDAHVVLSSEILNAFINKESVIAIFFDIHKAYDRIWHVSILRQLHKWGLKGHLPRFIQGFLKNRLMQVRVQECYSTTRTQLNGIPQGSVISPLLFMIAINDLKDLFVAPIQHCLFADDWVVFIRTKNLAYAQQKLQECLSKMEIWSKEKGIQFSTEKTCCVNFNRLNNRIGNNIKFKLNNKHLIFKNEINYLGLTYDNRLNWKKHISNLKAKCFSGLNLMKCLSKIHWGADRNTLTKIYKLTILSKLDFCSQIYNSASDATLRALDPVHHLGIRLCSGAYFSSPTISLCAEAGIAPLQYRRQMLSLTLVNRITSNINHPRRNYILHPQYSNLYLNKPNFPRPFNLKFQRPQSETWLNPTSRSPPWIQNQIDCIWTLSSHKKEDTPAIIYKIELKAIFQSHHDFTPIYTDGSKTENFTSAAFINGDNQRVYLLPNDFSNFSSELYAILKALESLNITDQAKYLILSDSFSGIQAITSPKPIHPIAMEIKNLIYNLTSTQNLKIKLCWIPGHTGIVGNEMVDALTKRVEGLNIEINKIPKVDLDQISKKVVFNIWGQKWDSTINNKLRLVKADIKPLKTSNQDSRKNEIALTRLRIGHSNITNSYIWKKEHPPVCETCNTQLTVKHILIDCTKFRHIRAKLQLDNNINTVLNDDPKNVEKLLQFLTESDILNCI